MLWFFLGFVVVPLFLLGKAGFWGFVQFVIELAIFLLVFILWTSFGLTLDFMFFGEEYRLYKMPTLFTDAYANNLPSLGHALLIPFIVVFDILHIFFHFILTEAGWLTWIFATCGAYVVTQLVGIKFVDEEFNPFEVKK